VALPILEHTGALMNSLLIRLGAPAWGAAAFPSGFSMYKESHKKMAEETNSPGYWLLVL
jgi:hypothetical protein